MDIFAPFSDDGLRPLPASELAIGVSADALLEALCAHGALLIRDRGVASVDDFDAFITSLNLPRLSYVYRSTPRTAVGSGIFTATEYPPEEHIPLHNENAYQRRWPLALAFCCLTPAEAGGETPIADMRRVTAAIPAELMRKFATLGVRYTRVYRGKLDLPWSVVFQTENPSEVEAFCRENGLLWSWEGETLRTMQVCQGTATHPRTGEEFLFNQAHLFHPSSLDPDVAELLIETVGEAGLPRHAHFGDGTPIPDVELSTIRAAFTASEVVFSWQAGDILLVDNMRVAHGRRPFKGRRHVLAALLQGYSADQSVGTPLEPQVA